MRTKDYGEKVAEKEEKMQKGGRKKVCIFRLFFLHFLSSKKNYGWKKKSSG